MHNDLDELIRAVTRRETAANTDASSNLAAPAKQVVAEQLQMVLPATPSSAEPTELPLPERARESVNLSSHLDDLRRTIAAQAAATSENTQALLASGTKAPAGSNSSATTEQVFKTVTSTLTISPIITGIAKLFGAFRKHEEPPALEPFTLPPSIRLDAGLDAGTQNLSPVSYSQGYQPRLSQPTVAPMAPIQVNVNALDSQSFLDHSEDIARAVKEAMLHAHSLNDVVAEL